MQAEVQGGATNHKRTASILIKIVVVLLIAAASNIWQVELRNLFKTSAGRPPVLWGVLIVGGLLLLFGGTFYWLYLSPMTEKVIPKSDAKTLRRRRLVGLALTASSALFLAGGIVDIMWHFWLGGFGDDFLWFPHQMIYGAFLINVVVAGTQLGSILFGPGSMRLKARQEPALGVAALANTFILASVPSDLLWHRIYGVDITPWSLPHVLLLGMAACSTLSAVFLLLTSRKPNESSKVVDVAVYFLVTVLAWIPMIFMLPEYDMGGTTASSSIMVRPGWLYPFLVFLIGMTVTILIYSITRRAGSATIIALIALGGRILFQVGAMTLPIDAQSYKFSGQLILLFAAVAFDLGLVRLKNHSGATIRERALRAGVVYWAVFWLVAWFVTVTMQIGPAPTVLDVAVGPILGLGFLYFYALGIIWVFERFPPLGHGQPYASRTVPGELGASAGD